MTPEENKRRNKEWRDRMKKDGRCCCCGKPTEHEGIYCIKCKKKRYASKRRRIEKRMKNGICVTCGSKLPLNHKTTECIKCTEKKKYRGDVRSARLAAQGLCISCGKEKAVYGYSKCHRCRILQHARDVNRREITKFLKEVGVEY